MGRRLYVSIRSHSFGTQGRSQKVKHHRAVSLLALLTLVSIVLAACSGGQTASSSAAAPTSAAASTASSASSTPSSSTSGKAAPSANSTASAQQVTLTVWTDATRVPAFKAYEKTHPNVHLKIQVVNNELQKVLLDNRAGSGWPDVVWDPGSPDIVRYISSQYHFAKDISPYVSKTVWNTFPAWTHTLCGRNNNSKIYCLENDIASESLWYNAKLMKQFGYQVPTTWLQYEELGLKVAKEHPGYLIGEAGDSNGLTSYFWPSECPAGIRLAHLKVGINLESPNCTRVVQMLDPLIKAGVVSPYGFSATQVVQAGKADKILMMPGPSWFGQYVFNNTYKTPAGELSVALPLRWPNTQKQPVGGDLGGGIYLVSSHTKYPQAATDVITWITTDTSPQGYQISAPTFPAYPPAAKAWKQNLDKTKYFATNPYNVLNEAVGDIWTGWGYVNFSRSTVYSQTIAKAIQHHDTVASAVQDFQTKLIQEAQLHGDQVDTKVTN